MDKPFNEMTIRKHKVTVLRAGSKSKKKPNITQAEKSKVKRFADALWEKRYRKQFGPYAPGPSGSQTWKDLFNFAYESSQNALKQGKQIGALPDMEFKADKQVNKQALMPRFADNETTAEVVRQLPNELISESKIDRTSLSVDGDVTCKDIMSWQIKRKICPAEQEEPKKCRLSLTNNKNNTIDDQHLETANGVSQKMQGISHEKMESYEAVRQKVAAARLKKVVKSAHNIGDTMEIMICKRNYTSVVSGKRRKCDPSRSEAVETNTLGTDKISPKTENTELTKLTPAQLKAYEETNPHLAIDTNVLWEAHYRKNFGSKNETKGSQKRWRDLYLKADEERQARLQAIRSKVIDLKAAMPEKRKAKFIEDLVLERRSKKYR
jgi:hypothetical protein